MNNATATFGANPAASRPAGGDVASSWLAAYALGIAYARDDARDFVPQLVKIAGYDIAVLVAARARLDQLDTVHEPAHREARRLLNAAVRHATPRNIPTEAER